MFIQRRPIRPLSFFIERRPSTVWQQGETTPPKAVQSTQETVPEAIHPIQEAPNSQIPTPSINHPVLPRSHWNSVDMSLLQAGRVAHCLDNWKQITTDPWILQVVQGYQIEWSKTPFQVHPAITSVTSKEAALLVEEEVDSLLQKGAVVPPCTDQFISRLFLVEKKDKSSFRPVINLKPLNTFIQKEHFKMEGASMIKDLLQPGDWMCSLDLKDAYLTVPIAKEHRKYLRFLWDGRIFEFTCLPFGLCSAP